MNQPDRKERAKKLVEFIKKDLTAGPVCDSVMKCEGWENYNPTPWHVEYNQIKEWKYCPWCGKEIKWEAEI